VFACSTSDPDSTALSGVTSPRSFCCGADLDELAQTSYQRKVGRFDELIRGGAA
jgi:hypothetical protein